MENAEFLSKILWDLSNLNEEKISPALETKLDAIRWEIAQHLGLDEMHDNTDAL